MGREFDSDYQPAERKPRGKSFHTKLLESLERKGITEEGFIDLLVERATVDGGVYLTELMKRYVPIHKQTYEPIKFEYNAEWTAIKKADAIMAAVANGDISPDVGSMIIEAISKVLGIEEVTDLAKRLEALEEIMKAKDA